MSIVVAIIAFSLLVIVHEAGHFLVARLCGMRVERFSVGFGPVLASFRRGETEYAFSALPFGGYVKIAGMAAGEEVDPADRSAYANQAAWRRFLVILTGPAMNYVAAAAIAIGMIASVGLPRPDPGASVGAVTAGKPADRAGLKSGDRILAVAGKPVDSWKALVAEIQAHPSQKIALLVRRGPEGTPPLTLEAEPENVGGHGRLSFGPLVMVVRAGLAEAVVTGVHETNARAAEILAGLGQVVTRKQKAELSGPIGIAQELANGARAGTATFLNLVLSISLVLALLNLLPIPALDGGRLVFLVYEIVTRRRVNQRVENVVHLAGFIALFGLLLAVTVFGDLARLFHR